MVLYLAKFTGVFIAYYLLLLLTITYLLFIYSIYLSYFVYFLRKTVRQHAVQEMGLFLVSLRASIPHWYVSKVSNNTPDLTATFFSPFKYLDITSLLTGS